MCLCVKVVEQSVTLEIATIKQADSLNKYSIKDVYVNQQ